MDRQQKSRKQQKKNNLRNEIKWLEYFFESIGVPNKADLAELIKLSTVLHAAKPSSSARQLSSFELLQLKKKCTKVSIANADSSGISNDKKTQARCKVRQGLAHFLCGYYDLDFRDVAHFGHANVLRFAKQTDYVKKVLHDSYLGELVGIMMTEPKGGSKLKMNTSGIEVENGVKISGEKCWISRYEESRYMIILYQNVSKALLEAAILDKTDAKKGKLVFRKSTPIGLKGWSWGKITLRDVYIPKSQVLTFENIDTSLRTHFAYYRLLIAILVLGAAAKVLDLTVMRLEDRLENGSIAKVRDSQLEILGSAHAIICEGVSAILSLLPHFTSQTLGIHHMAIASSLKGHIIHHAYESIDAMSQMHGAAGYDSSSVLSKTLLDARGFIFADGIQSELLRSVGKTLFTGV